MPLSLRRPAAALQHPVEAIRHVDGIALCAARHAAVSGSAPPTASATPVQYSRAARNSVCSPRLPPPAALTHRLAPRASHHPTPLRANRPRARRTPPHPQRRAGCLASPRHPTARTACCVRGHHAASLKAFKKQGHYSYVRGPIPPKTQRTYLVPRVHPSREGTARAKNKASEVPKPPCEQQD